jgi:hypothetical protein
MPDAVSATARAASKAGRRHFAIIAATFVTIMCLGGWLAATWDIFSYITRRDGVGWAGLDGVTDARTAKVVYDLGQKCQQILFDNDTGGLAGSGRPCATPDRSAPDRPAPAAADSKAVVPEPLGTVRRLEAISKAFNK